MGRAETEELRSAARAGGQWYDCDETGGVVMIEMDGDYTAYEVRLKDIRTSSAYFLQGLATYESGWDAGVLSPGWASWADDILIALQDEPNATHQVLRAPGPPLLPDDFDGLDEADKVDAVARLAAAILYTLAGRADRAAEYVRGGHAYRAQEECDVVG